MPNIYKPKGFGGTRGQYKTALRDSTENPDLNLVLYLLNGIRVQERKIWMMRLFPKTLRMLGWNQTLKEMSL